MSPDSKNISLLSVTVCAFMRERLKMSHMLTHNVLSPPHYSLPRLSHPPLLPPPPICLSSLSHLLPMSPIPLSPLSHLSLISLLSSLSSLVHNITAVVRQSHSFHQRDQEWIFLGRGLLWAALPQRINHVQTLMPCYTDNGMRLVSLFLSLPLLFFPPSLVSSSFSRV